jgi:hypothetical protein
MASFKQQKQRDLADERFLGAAQVWVESTRDQKLLAEYLFPDEGEHMEFRPADDGAEGGGGCAKVLKYVTRDRDNKIAAFGLVDRDVLFRDLGKTPSERMAIFLEPDETQFRMALDELGLSAFVRVLGAWEIESYLLFRYEALLREHRASGDTTMSPSALHESLRTLVEQLIPDSAAKVLCHIKGLKAFSRGHERKLSTRELVREAAREHALNASRGNAEASSLVADWESAMKELEERVQAFSQGEIDPERWWRKAARILDAKVLLRRFSSVLRSGGKGNPGEDEVEQLKFRLAQTLFERRVSDPTSIDDELREHIESFRPRTA